MVGQRMWQRDWPAVHVALNAEWSEDVSDIMAALKGIYSKLRVSILNYSKYFFVYLSESYLFFQKKFLKILYFNFFKKKTIPMKSYKKKKKNNFDACINYCLFFSDNVRERAITLISKAYSSLSLTVFASMTGLTLEEARRVAIERGWNVDGTMVQPCKIQKEESNLVNEVCLTEDQLYKLTQFVSFLEN